jgi:hypothetical protein
MPILSQLSHQIRVQLESTRASLVSGIAPAGTSNRQVAVQLPFRGDVSPSHPTPKAAQKLQPRKRGLRERKNVGPTDNNGKHPGSRTGNGSDGSAAKEKTSLQQERNRSS